MLTTKFARNARPIYAQTGLALGEEDIRRFAPSVFADGAHESRSERYTYIPTIHVLRGLQAHGFCPFYAIQAKTRDAANREHTKHMLRLRHPDAMAKAKGDSVNEVILINSHNGTSSYQMLAGCFRFVCSNGMVVGDTAYDVRVKHSGDVREQVIEGAFRVMDGFAKVDESREAFVALRLTDGAQRAFAGASLALRYGTDAPPPVSVEQVLQPRRVEDSDPTLWATFQRVQEHLTQGGLRTTGRQRRGHTRPVQGIDGNVALNRGLWVLAEEMRRMVAA